MDLQECVCHQGAELSPPHGDQKAFIQAMGVRNVGASGGGTVEFGLRSGTQGLNPMGFRV